MTSLHIIRFPVGESIAMLLEQFEQEIAIEQIALGAALLESFTQASQGGGVDQVELEEFISHECMDECPAFLFDGHSHLFAAEALAQTGDPLR